MKKLMYIFFAVCLALLLVSCSLNNAQDEEGMVLDSSTEIQNQDADATNSGYTKNEEQPFEGKIAIVSNGGAASYDEYGAAKAIVNKYGADKVTHVTWPDNFMNEQEQMVKMMTEIAADQNIRVLILYQAVPGSNIAVDELLKTRNDIFVIYCIPQDRASDVVQRANLTLNIDDLGMGIPMIQQAHKMGAKVFVHYSIPRHMEQLLFATRRTLMEEECEKLGIEFIDATIPDPIGEAGTVGAENFIFDDVPKMVKQWGKDTAFFATICSIQPALIESVINTNALYPQPCCPSPYHGLTWVLNVDVETDGVYLPIQDVIAQEREAIAAKHMTGRISTWPNLSSMVLTVASADYTIKWINGEVPQKGVDVDVLKQLMMDYAGVEVYLTPYTDAPPYTEEGTGETYDNFLLMRMDYITF